MAHQSRSWWVIGEFATTGEEVLLKLSRVMPNIVHIMKEWEYTFGPVSREEWIRQIESDLRQKPLASTYSAVWEGATLIPFVHANDVNEDIVRLPDALFAHPPGIAEWVETSSMSEEAVNQHILDSLHFGAQSIILKSDVATESMLRHWLRGVLMELVTVSIELPESGIPEILAIQENELNPVLVRIERNGHSPSIASWIEAIQHSGRKMEGLRFIYRFPSSGPWDVETATTFKRLLNDLAIWEANGLPLPDFFNQCLLVPEADSMYFKHILQTRILHLLWLNLKSKFLPANEQVTPHIECHIQHFPAEPSDKFLIRASMSGLAAALCGTTTLCIHPSAEPDSPAFYKRINRNIHHLLELECGMYKGTDPLGGAYAMDYHTKLLTYRIWDMLFQKK